MIWRRRSKQRRLLDGVRTDHRRRTWGAVWERYVAERDRDRPDPDPDR